MGADGESVSVTIVDVQDTGAERVYALDWGEHAGPSKIVVRGGQVLVGESAASSMQEPWEMPGGIFCYAEDYSNPDGCEDVCDAALCLSEGSGVVMVSGLYAPEYASFAAR
jgi:hypothetical protein